MGPWMGALIGVAKSELFDRPEQERQEKMRAEEIRFSPWLNVAPRQVGAAPSTGNAAIQGGFAGLDYQQRLSQNKKEDVPIIPADTSWGKLDPKYMGNDFDMMGLSGGKRYA